MTAIGGSITSLNIDGRLFAVASDSDSTRDLGGSKNEVQPNGNGTVRLVKTVGPWMLEGIAVEIDDSRNDHEFLQERANSNTLFAVSITYASGLVYQGVGQLTGDLKTASQAQTAAINLMGQGELTQQ